MSPEPWVRLQALLTAGLFITAAVLGSALAALICAGTGLAAFALLRTRYRGDVRQAQASIPPHRERLDCIVAGDAHTAFAVGLAAGGVLLGFGVAPADVRVDAATAVFAAVALEAVYLSSLVDWYIILPRITGQLGLRPCRAENGAHPSYPKSWRETTRLWYVHRILGAVLYRFGLVYAIAAIADDYISIWGGAKLIGAVAVALIFRNYLALIPRAVLEAAHLKVVVGWTVQRAGEYVPFKLFTLLGRDINLPFFGRVRSGRPVPREYVFDVELEGFQLVPAAPREQLVPLAPDGTVIYERKPLRLPLKFVHVCEPADPPFSGCDNRCSGISWYCIENPRCFEPK